MFHIEVNITINQYHMYLTISQILMRKIKVKMYNQLICTTFPEKKSILLESEELSRQSEKNTSIWILIDNMYNFSSHYWFYMHVSSKMFCLHKTLTYQLFFS